MHLIYFSTQFKSRFSVKKRLVALILVFVFLFPQIVYAKSYKGKYPDLSPLFEGPKVEDQAIGLGIAVASLAIPYIAAPVSQALNTVSLGLIPVYTAPALTATNLATNFAVGAFIGTTANAGVTLAVREFGADPATAQLVGMVTIGALGGMYGGATGAFSDASSLGMFSGLAESPILAGALIGGLQGVVQAGGSILAEKAGLPPAVGSWVAGIGSYVGFHALLNIDSMFQGNFDPMTKAIVNPNFLNYVVSQGVVAGIETALGEKNKYAGLISQPIGQMLGAALTPVITSSIIGGNEGLRAWYLDTFKVEELPKVSAGNIMRAGLEGAILGGIDVGVKSLTGLTPIQQEGVRFLATAFINEPLRAIINPSLPSDKRLKSSFENLQTSFLGIGHSKFGETGFGVGSWNSFRTNEAIAGFAGVANFYRNAQQLMQGPPKQEGGGFQARIRNINQRLSNSWLGRLGRQDPNSWDRIVSEGRVRQILPSLDKMLLNRSISALSSASTDNINLKYLFEKQQKKPYDIDAKIKETEAQLFRARARELGLEIKPPQRWELFEQWNEMNRWFNWESQRIQSDIFRTQSKLLEAEMRNKSK